MRRFCIIFFFVISRFSHAALQLGCSHDDVIAELGKPLGEMNSRGVQVMSYDGGVVELKNGHVIYIEPHFGKRAAARKAQLAFEAEQRAKGLVQYNGEWIATDEAERLQKEDASRKNAVQEIRQKGKSVDLQKIIEHGKINIVDFFAEWCGPCKRLSPQLEDLVKNDGDLRLQKIDIVSWDSDVAKQYNIQSVPNVWVFDRNGQLVGKPTHDIFTIKNYVQQAK